jgi:hypothetical protein
MADENGGPVAMCRIVSSLVIATLTVLTPASGAAQAPQPPPKVDVQQPTAGIDAILAYAGTWKVTGERFTTLFSAAGKEETTLRNDCSKIGDYIVCNQYVDGQSKVLIVYTYSDLLKMYTTYPIPRNGESASAGRLQIVGNVWTFPWEVRQGQGMTYFRVVNVFSGSDHIDYVQEFSPDNIHWTPMAKGSETRIGK